MKIAVSRLMKDEKGAAMVVALIMLLIGGLVSAPLLSHMSTGIVTGEVYEVRTAELYAADAGVEDAVWNIQHEVPEVMGLSGCYPDWSYNMSDVNGKSVDVTITLVNNVTFTYRVVSTATGDGSGTQIDAYITGTNMYGNYTDITNHVITSQGDIILKGEIYYPEGSEPAANYAGAWPTPEELAQYYGEDVEGLTPYPSDTIDLSGADMELGPLYRDGALEIENSIDPEATLTLTGTIYITDDTLISPTKDLTLDLNGHTIFVESSSIKPPVEALYIGGKCSIIGPGVIIAVGDIYFEPNIPGGMTDPIFIMSVEGTTTLKPGGDFYGAVAGSVEVELYPGTSLVYPEEGFVGLNFPGFTASQLIYSIFSWELIQQ